MIVLLQLHPGTTVYTKHTIQGDQITVMGIKKGTVTGISEVKQRVERRMAGGA